MSIPACRFRRAAVQPRVQVDIGQILALLGGEGFPKRLTPAIRSAGGPCLNTSTDECTLSGRTEPVSAELMQLLSGGTHAAQLKPTRRSCWRRTAGPMKRLRGIGVGKSTIYRTKRRFVLGNLRQHSAKSRAATERKFSGKEEALLVATACSSPPASGPVGRWSCWPARWSSSPRMRAYR